MLHRLPLLVLIIAIMLSASSPALAIDPKKVEQEMSSSGAEGWIHGSVQEKGLYVFTYRNPENFFDYLELSLVAADAGVQSQLASFKRHDKVRVKGSFMKNPSPQIHVMVSSVELIKKYESKYPSQPYPYDAAVPDELLKGREATFLVHAIAGEGKVLVLEYKDAIVPMFAPKNKYVTDLSRNDVVQLQYSVRQSPGQPTHLEVEEGKKAVKLIERIGDINGKPASVEGTLVMFPKSPEISLNVFAVLQETTGGFNRQFTIVNFEDPAVFKGAREKLQQAWDKYPNEYTNGRNKLVSKKLRVKVKGTYNQVDANQANPQILISSIDDVQIVEL